MDRVIQMALRMGMNYLMRGGMRKGMQMFSNRKKTETENPNATPQQSDQKAMRQRANVMKKMRRF